MLIRFTVPAESFERFDPGAFHDMIGLNVPVTMDGEAVGDGTLVAAQVADDGTAVTLTVQIAGIAEARHTQTVHLPGDSPLR